MDHTKKHEITAIKDNATSIHAEDSGRKRLQV
jgi:hypothetical protein